MTPASPRWMGEASLVAFSLLAQMAVGVFWAVLLLWVMGVGGTGAGQPAPVGPGVIGAVGAGAAGTPGTVGPGAVGAGAEGAAAANPWLTAPLLLVGVLLLAAALVSLAHLGSPRRAWRALGNLGSSWLSREILFLMLFGAGWAAFALLETGGLAGSVAMGAVGGTAGALGLALLWTMARLYRLPAVPSWNTPLTPASFFLTAGSLGALGTALILALEATERGGMWDEGAAVSLGYLVLAAALFLFGEFILEPRWRVVRRRAVALVDPGLNPGAGSPERGAHWRPALLAAALVLSTAGIVLLTRLNAAWATAPEGALAAALGAAFAAALGAAVLGRVRFYRSRCRRGL